jgi:clan AA aspartic protease
MSNLELSTTDPLHPTLILQILAGDKKAIPALIDTGFDSYLCIPKSVVEELQLEVIGEDEIEIANGQNYLVNICVARICLPELGNIKIEVECIISDDGEALIGTKLLQELFQQFSIDFSSNKLIFRLSPDFY